MNKLVYCITTEGKWNSSQINGKHVEESLDKEGFIHCSYPHVYGAIDTDAVVAVYKFNTDSNGALSLPEKLKI